MNNTIQNTLTVFLTVAGLVHPQVGLAGGQSSVRFEVSQRDGRWQLLRDARPFHVKGAVGWHSYERLARAGGNAVRTSARKANLDRAHRSGLMVLANLPVRGRRDGMDWDDMEALTTQRERVLKTVRETWPDNRAPAVLSLDIGGFPNARSVYLKPGQRYEAKLACYDPGYNPLTFQWDIRPEVEIPENSYAGSMEKAAKPIPGLIGEAQGSDVQFTASSSTCSMVRATSVTPTRLSM